MSTVLVVDDKEMLRDSVGATLQRAGFTVQTAPSGQAALETVVRRRPDAIVTDLKMPGMTGLDLLEKLREIDDDLPVVLMTAFGTVDTAVQAIKLGAFDYVTKPFEGDELIVAVKRAIEHARLKRENAVLRSGGAENGSLAPTPGGLRGLDRLIGDSAAMRRVKQQVLAVAESHGTVLICGESGTGKEVVARAVHELSLRSEEPFLAVNCAALSEALLESELFGHERGAFTGAEKLRKGRFELADRGTLLLDEISEIPAQTQAKLLRVLQERAFERVGSSVTIGIDVRVVATSNRDLPKAAARGDFRQDLFFRLNVLPIHLPPLRDRVEDIPELVSWFLGRVSEREGRESPRLTEEALTVLQAYSWPGNVRELQNICERAAVLCRGETIDRGMIEPWLLASDHALVASSFGFAGGGVPSVAGENGTATGHGQKVATSVEPKGWGVPMSGEAASERHVEIEGRLLEDIERETILRTLTKHHGHRQKTAKSLGIGVRTLGLKLKKWKEERLIDASV